MAKLLFYIVYAVGGGIISIFMPAEFRYIFGFLMSLLATWAHRVTSHDDEDDCDSEGSEPDLMGPDNYERAEMMHGYQQLK